ncbi:hypothetical protein [Moraxella lacunata]|uniref:hypothetical protein n=1 Tax=Moraxella lacunata TaxID=477 RepID=UPI003EE2A8F4
MTSKCTTSAPASSTAFVSSPRRAKSADKIDGAIRNCFSGRIFMVNNKVKIWLMIADFVPKCDF